MNLKLAINGLALVMLAGITALTAPVANATDTVPLAIVYNGHLLDSSGNPITTAHNIRFSFWTSADFVSGDVTAGGAINTSATTYAGWNETHTITPNSDGFFTVEMGTVTALPSIPSFSASTLTSMFLQVEVKASANPDTSYEVLDNDPSDATDDRSSILSVPFALNANYLDQHQVGTASGDIAVLQAGGLFDPATIPGGTNLNVFAIDADGSSTGAELRFGSGLEALSYDSVMDLFKFTGDLRVEGNMTVTGLINGVDINTIAASSDTQLRVQSGGGLTVDVMGGNYRLNGTDVNYAGVTGLGVTDATTNYVYFTSTGLVVSTAGFPATQAIIRLAEVVAAGGSITTVTDRRVLSSDDREKDVIVTMRPLFEATVYEGDGTSNVGRLRTDHDGATDRTFYEWTTSQSTLQDYDIKVRGQVPQGFQSWNTPAMTLEYQTTSGLATDAALDITMTDTAGAAVTLAGSSTGLASAAWTSTTLNFSGSPTWTSGEEFILTIKTSATTGHMARIGDLKLNFHVLEP